MKKAIARPEIGIWTERVTTLSKLLNLYKRFTVNPDGWRVCHSRNTMRDSHQEAIEYHNLAAHAHRTAALHHGQEEHLTGHEHSRQALEHSNTAYQHSLGMHQKAKTDQVVIVRTQEAREEDIPALAYT
jgi:ABC-type transport system involved in Fe-S cluster assembly fused permease/ATPase subunit